MYIYIFSRYEFLLLLLLIVPHTSHPTGSAPVLGAPQLFAPTQYGSAKIQLLEHGL